MVRNQFNFKRQVEVLDPVSVTVPDQSFTVKQLIERHRSGMLTDFSRNDPGVYIPDMDHSSPDYEKLVKHGDLIDQANFKAEVSERVEKVKGAYDKHVKAEAQKKFDADVLAKAEELKGSSPQVGSAASPAQQ